MSEAGDQTQWRGKSITTLIIYYMIISRKKNLFKIYLYFYNSFMLVHHYIKIINQNLGKINFLHTYLGNWDCKLKMII